MTDLKAQRELWKENEARPAEDNRTLMDERSRLNKMISGLQKNMNSLSRRIAAASRVERTTWSPSCGASGASSMTRLSKI